MAAAPGDPGITSRFTVVLWLPTGGAAPERLVHALTARRIRIRPAASAYGALAAICMASRAARVSQGSAGGTALVIVNPEQQPESRAVLDAAGKYAPGVRCWMFGPAANPKLRALVESDAGAWGGQAEVEKKPEVVVRPRAVEEAESKPARVRQGMARPDYRTPVGQPALRLAGEGTLDPGPEAVDVEKGPETVAGAAPPTRGQLLTPEELQMLLGDDGPDVAEKR